MLFRNYLFFFLIFNLVSCVTKENNSKISICVTGDLLMDRGVRKIISINGVAHLFADVSTTFVNSDFTIANLECPVTKIIQPVNKRFIFRAEPEWLPYLSHAGITHLIMANNHTYDQGRQALQQTYENILENNMIPIGAGNTHITACKPIIMQNNSLSVAVFSSVVLGLENWTFLPSEFSVCQKSPEELADDILLYHKQNPSSKILVILHWGVEYQSIPTITQRNQARKLINAGADAIVGHHPHVIQQMEWIENKPVYYSIGNFVFDSTRPEAKKGLILKLVFDAQNLKIEEFPFKIQNCKPFLQKN